MPGKQSARKVKDNGLPEPFVSVPDEYPKAAILY
jgi:hypothetical protein